MFAGDFTGQGPKLRQSSGAVVKNLHDAWATDPLDPSDERAM